MLKGTTELYTGGCSFFTRAYDFDIPGTIRKNRCSYQYKSTEAQYFSFPAFLSAKLNLKLINDAAPGHSNTYIIRKAYEYIKNKPKSTRSIAVIGLTEIARQEIPIQGTTKYHHITPSDYHTNTRIYENSIEKYAPIPIFVSAMDEYYKYVYNDRTAITSLIQQLNMLAAYCQINSTRLYVFCSFAIMKKSELLGKYYDELSSTKNNFIFFNFGQNNNQLCSWVDFIMSYAPDHKGGHPWVYDNNLLANIMASFIKEGKFKKMFINPTEYEEGYNYLDKKPKFPKPASINII